MKDFDLPPDASVGFVPHAGVAIRHFGETVLSTCPWTIPEPDDDDERWIAGAPAMARELSRMPEILPHATTDRAAFLA